MILSLTVFPAMIAHGWIGHLQLVTILGLATLWHSPIGPVDL